MVSLPFGELTFLLVLVIVFLSLGVILAVRSRGSLKLSKLDKALCVNRTYCLHCDKYYTPKLTSVCSGCELRRNEEADRLRSHLRQVILKALELDVVQAKASNELQTAVSAANELLEKLDERKPVSLFKGDDHDRHDDNEPTLPTVMGDNDTRRIIRSLIMAGDNLAIHYTSHSRGCNCITCQSVADWQKAKAEGKKLL